MLIVIGVAAAIFTVASTMAASKPSDASTIGTAASNPDPGATSVVVPLVVALGGIGVGGGMLLFGGHKGYDKVQNPAVRN
jgi:hypothetical protein